jgi:hypothetical protein
VFDVFESIPLIPLQPLPQARSPAPCGAYIGGPVPGRNEFYFHSCFIIYMFTEVKVA